MADIGQHAELEWDEQGQPISSHFGDVYFSKANGLEETRHVFLHHNQLAERFTRLSSNSVFCIGETGFGSGLNFLAAWELWQQTAPQGARLHFITAEKFPLSQADLCKALALWPSLSSLTRPLIDAYPAWLHPGFHRLSFAEGAVQLTLMIGDAADMFGQLLHDAKTDSSTPIDAWFLDGFAPAKNPEMWSDALFSSIARLSMRSTTAATFSAAGIVKRGLRSAGFTVKKVPGYGRKREMVSAFFSNPEIPSPETTTLSDGETPALPTQLPPLPVWCQADQSPDYSKRTALIVGGGLAGCHSARALAERGWNVTVLERAAQLATGGSGNRQGVVYARLSPQFETQAAFNVSCLQFALRFYRPFWQQEGFGASCGVLQLAHTEQEAAWQERLREQFERAPDLVQFVSVEQANQLAGVPLKTGGIFFPKAGWIDPAALCHSLVDHPSIQVVTNTSVSSLTHSAEGWRANASDSNAVFTAAVVIIATARDALAFDQSAQLPLKSIRGQTTLAIASDASQALKTVLCGEGYMAPALADDNVNRHSIGATFAPGDNDEHIRQSDHQRNIDNINAVLAPGAQLSLTDDQTAGRVCFRCATPDYLPLIGKVPQRDNFITDYAALRTDATTSLQKPGSYWPGLYINAGHGSRGLAYTPLCAELLACEINGEPLPFAASLVQSLHPARFIIRDLIRKRC